MAASPRQAQAALTFSAAVRALLPRNNLQTV